MNDTTNPTGEDLGLLVVQADQLAHSITYRVALGPRSGQKVFTLQSVPAGPEGEQKKV